MDELSDGEQVQFKRAVAEDRAGSGGQEWEQLMLMVTVNSNGNGHAYERRQMVRRMLAQKQRALEVRAEH